MKRADVDTPTLERELTKLESTLFLTRKRRTALLRVGEVMRELERDPDITFTVRLAWPASDPFHPIMRAWARGRSLNGGHIRDVLAFLKLTLGAPLADTISREFRTVIYETKDLTVYLQFHKESQQ